MKGLKGFHTAALAEAGLKVSCHTAALSAWSPAGWLVSVVYWVPFCCLVEFITSCDLLVELQAFCCLLDELQAFCCLVWSLLINWKLPGTLLGPTE